MGIVTVSLIIAAFVSASLGIAALMRNFRSRLCIYFAAVAGALFTHDALGVLETFESVGRFASPRAHAVSMLILGPAILLFVAALLPRYQKRIRRLTLGYVPVAIFLFVLMFMPAYSRLSPWVLFFSHISVLFPAVVMLFSLDRAQRDAKLPRERVRLRYAFFGAAITIAFFTTDALNFAGAPVPPLGTLARVLFLIFLFQTFIQKELMTAEEVVAKTALFGSVAITLSVIYALLVSWVGDKPDLFFFNTFIASFVIIVLFDPIRKMTTRFTRRLFLRRNSMLEDELNRLSLELMGMVEPVEIAKRIGSMLRKSLGVEASALYLIQTDGLSYIRIGEKSSFVSELSSSSTLVEYMSLRRGRPFVLETIENDRESFHSAQPRKFCQSCVDTMRDLGTDFVIPLLHESRLVGFCLATTGERAILSNEQLRLFIPISRQVASLLKNAQTFVTLRDRDKLAAMGEMAAGLAHEIKNPLGAIKGAAQLLKEEGKVSDPTAQDFVGIILAETDRLSSVLSDFLDYARPRRNYPQASCDPVRVIEHTAALILRDSKVAFELESEKEGLATEADPEILKQVLLNLFINAVQAMKGFTDRPSLKVRVREIRPHRLLAFADSLPLYKIFWEGWETATSVPPRALIEIEVQDNGCGIPSDERSRVFIPFYTTKPKGTGLGLSICQRLVEGMGGTITVKPNHPHGTTFVIHLPPGRDDERDPLESPPRTRTKELSQ